MSAGLNFVNSCDFPKGLNDTSIVLISKKPQPEYISDMRPIALCNVLLPRCLQPIEGGS